MAKEKEIDIRKFVESIQKLIDNSLRHSTVDAIVSSDTDMTKFTCSVKIGTIEYFDVPIRVLISKQASFLEIPKKESHCLVTFRDANQNRPQLLEIDECEKIMILIGEQKLEINETGFIFNEGSLDGLCKVNEVVSKINAIENDLNNLKIAFNTWVPAPMDGGAVLKSTTASWAAQTIVNTVKNDLENTKIKQ